MIKRCNLQYFSIKSYVVAVYKNRPEIICCGCVLESPRRGDSNTQPQHKILWRTDGNQGKTTSIILYFWENFMCTETFT